MDKLRAIEYFNRAVEHGTFAATARALGVSKPAVTQLVAALERSLGATLLHRTKNGLVLTADGEKFHEVAQAIESELREVEQRLASRGAQPRGTLVVGLRGSLSQNYVMPRIGRFLERYPEIELVLKPVETLDELDAQHVDVAVMTGWPPKGDYAVRTLAETRDVVCASPQYWLRAGKPQVPEDLADHHCLVIRSSGGALVDRWTFERDGERRTIDVRSRLLSYQGTWIQEAACAGVGVIRLGELALARYLAGGLLEPALTDWEILEAPIQYVAYRPAQRRSKRVRAFVDFLVDIFAEVDGVVASGNVAGAGRRLNRRVTTPEWYGRVKGRQSAAHAGGKSTGKKLVADS